MKRTLAIGAALAALLAVPAHALLDSGVRGTVTLGPTTPVCRPDVPCTRPYETRVTIRGAFSGRLIRRVRTDSRGRFRARLRAGRYRLRAVAGSSASRCDPVRARVRRHRFTRVALRCDTGLR